MKSIFDNIAGNSHVKSYLIRMVENGKIGNSLLFTGPEGIGKSLFATAFAKLLFAQQEGAASHLAKIDSGNHPDLHIYKPEGKTGMHSIDTMRQFCEEVYIAPFESKWKVFILHDAERMLPTSANALLKTFEEPAEDAIIILLSASPSSLLPTVLSRCRKIAFHPLSSEDIASVLINAKNIDAHSAAKAASMAQGSIGRAFRIAEEGSDPLRTKLLDLLASENALTYKQLANAAEDLANQVETRKKQTESEIRDLIFQGKDNLTAAQKQSLEKELEGAVSMRGNEEARALFDVILQWYRDLQLHELNGPKHLLQHKDYEQTQQNSLKRGRLLPMNEVQKILAEAALSLERSTSLAICLENIFLKLRLNGS